MVNTPAPRLKEKYIKEVAPELSKEFEIKNKFAYPKVTKVIINMGVGEAIKNKELMQTLKKDMATITGQTPSTRKAKVSVASFGVRRGMPVGLKVTLRGSRMYFFLDKLFSIVLPRLRDFRGVSAKSFDKNGNYTLGITEHTVFPEIDLAKSQPRGLEITIVTNTDKVDEAKRLLELSGMPFAKDGSGVNYLKYRKSGK
ncbi:50S ribosomal protein L5 [Candidatus Woesebacteria bacterium RIFCSPLOWO2_01_FULL_39_61]|uniref:Large ribosomal subunit protein uL5 n=2 Tax=Microgenomates group TaxID=1794810 RepID=A0A0H4TQ95_9BACT|nr:50S ribosomal protein L5, large subunit ribosomal protein L5 [uncultured Microgenomates bacterium Rifle_16ft_4_minimus_37836]OGM28076.1 MAG: 50S ribosomal protein L5 [Candidatus Woesebacteria bacterium RIFCSPHIGHO2_01_FULL_39_95]OGM34064.1 MAG: 50S ribosomal protein L5 [Candidatus Woesebacteria bacterium RIFCSPHIGHO2_02_FULL_39_13]OGM38323.1 MAG: 50S ribosomal protein L5 [Candidatus Woesebacteria bacterium RIFCSPHIGHO2_12_FULL_40_20]OGM67786.1 MAG: 50S ribosomal protein L5 [Candidatus Woeseb